MTRFTSQAPVDIGKCHSGHCGDSIGDDGSKRAWKVALLMSISLALPGCNADQSPSPLDEIVSEPPSRFEPQPLPEDVVRGQTILGLLRLRKWQMTDAYDDALMRLTFQLCHQPQGGGYLAGRNLDDIWDSRRVEHSVMAASCGELIMEDGQASCGPYVAALKHCWVSAGL